MTHAFSRLGALVFSAGVAAGLLLGAVAPTAQQGFERRIIHTKAIAASAAYEAVIGSATLPAGMVVPAHFHHGDEIGVVLEGEATLEVDGEAALKLKAGDVFHVPAARRHSAKNTGGGPARVISVWVVEKGKPLAVPAP